MKTNVKIKDGFFHIDIPISEAYEEDAVREFIDFLRVEKILSKSTVKDEFIKKLSDKTKETWWKNNKDRLLNDTDS